MVGRHAHIPLVFALALSACGGASGPGGPSPTPAAPESGVLDLRGSEFKFEPSRIALRVGRQVRIDFQNDGRILHDFNVEGLDADIAESNSSGPLKAGRDDLFVSADPGRSETLVFTPKMTGSFTFYCTVPRHRQLGMRGIAIVE